MKCPLCGNDKLDFLGTEIDDDNAEETYECYKCGSELAVYGTVRVDWDYSHVEIVKRSDLEDRELEEIIAEIARERRVADALKEKYSTTKPSPDELRGYWLR